MTKKRAVLGMGVILLIIAGMVWAQGRQGGRQGGPQGFLCLLDADRAHRTQAGVAHASPPAREPGERIPLKAGAFQEGPLVCSSVSGWMSVK